MQTWTSAVWRTEEFVSELRAFVADATGEPVSLEEVKIRPWAAVWRATTPVGVCYAKQNCPGQAHEAGLLAAMARIAPEYVVPVVAADPERDLLLTRDLGPTLRVQGRQHDPDVWCRILADGAELQRRLAPHVAELDLTAMTPECATDYVADAIGRLGALPPGDPRRLDEETAGRLRDLLPTIDMWAEEVAELGLPLTLDHNDLHDNNVVATDGDAPLRFFDFGDSVLADPLGSLLIPLRVCEDEFEADPDDPRLWRVADAALEVWSDRASMSQLRATLPAAMQLARLAKVESWRRCVAWMTAEEQAEWGGAPAAWLGTFLTEQPPIAPLTGAR